MEEEDTFIVITILITNVSFPITKNILIYNLTISYIIPIISKKIDIKVIPLYTFTYWWDLTISNIFPIISSNIPTKDISVYTLTYWDLQNSVYEEII